MLVRVLFALYFCIVWATVRADGADKTRWRFMEVDNLRVVSSLGKRDLKRVHREVHYFNRTLERIFNVGFIQTDRPVDALLLRTETEMRKYLGERAQGVAGIWGGMPGLRLFIIRKSGGPDLESIVFHELTHRHLDRINPPLWLNEGIAEIFETFQIAGKRVVFGKSNQMWLNYLNSSRSAFSLDYDTFFSLQTSSSHYTDPEKQAVVYSLAWVFAHYCWFGQPELQAAYLGLGAERRINEDTFIKHFGFGYGELDARLKGYVKRGRYEYFGIDLNKLPPPPEVVIRDATPDERIHLQARAYILGNNPEQARRLIVSRTEDDLGSVEVLASLAMMENIDFALDDYLAKAVDLGSQNPAILTRYVWRQLEEQRTMSGALSPDEGHRLTTHLLPALRLYPQFPDAIAAFVLILYASDERIPDNMEPVISYWEKHYGHTNRTLRGLIEELRSKATVEANAS